MRRRWLGAVAAAPTACVIAYSFASGNGLPAPPAAVIAPSPGFQLLGSSYHSVDGDDTHDAGAWMDVVIAGRPMQSRGALARSFDAHLITMGWTDQGTIGGGVGSQYGLTAVWLPSRRVCAQFSSELLSAPTAARPVRTAIRAGRPVIEVTLDYWPDASWCGYAQFMAHPNQNTGYATKHPAADMRTRRAGRRRPAQKLS